MSSQCTRKVLPIAAAAVMLVGGMSRMAAAKECTTDAECGAGNQCNLYTAGGGTGGSTGTASDPGAGAATGSTCLEGTNCTTGSVPVALVRDAGVAPQPRTLDAGVVVIDALPLAKPLLTGECGPKPIVCKTVADCPSADYECVKSYTVSPSMPCTQGEKCETTVPQESETGTCSAKPRACSTAADCPAPLTCQSQGTTCAGSASVGPDGVVTTRSETCTPGPSVCTWSPTVCTQDSDCTDPLYQCATVSEYSKCSAIVPACIRGDGGELCPTPDPPTCTTVVTKKCLPKSIDCGLGQACPSGWSCFDLADYTAGENPIWLSTLTDKSCLPDGVILWSQNHASGTVGSYPIRDSSGTSGEVDIGLQTPTTSKGTGTDSNGSVAGPTPAPVTPVSTTGVSTGTGTGTEVAAKAEGGGCAFGGGQSGSMAWGLALALVGLALQLARRRNANR